MHCTLPNQITSFLPEILEERISFIISWGQYTQLIFHGEQRLSIWGLTFTQTYRDGLVVEGLEGFQKWKSLVDDDDQEAQDISCLIDRMIEAATSCKKEVEV